MRPSLAFGLWLASALAELGTASLSLFLFWSGGGRNFLGAALVSGLPALLTVVWGVRVRGLPWINDVTTDPGRPPPLEAPGRRYPPRFAQAQAAAYPELRPLRLPHDPKVVFRAVQTLAQRMPGWQIHRVDRKGLSLQAVARTPIFHFCDDLAVVVRTEGGARVDMRSRSRTGKADLGANARRIENFLARLERALQGGSDRQPKTASRKSRASR